MLSHAQEAAELTLETFRDFARQYRYTRRDGLVRSFSHLQASYPEASPETAQFYRQEAVLMAGLLLETAEAKKAALNDLRVLFRQHPDVDLRLTTRGGEISPGLARPGRLAPSLLAKFGDDRARFPSPGSVQALAGTCPVTKSSGKRTIITFRYTCDREFPRNPHLGSRQIAVQPAAARQRARCSLGEFVCLPRVPGQGANAYFESVRPHCRSLSHAYRCLANRWLAVAWKLWQTRVCYDEGYHLRQRAIRAVPRA